MSKYPSVMCKLCSEPFETQVKIDPAIYALVPALRVGANTFICPHCQQRAEYSEQDFLYTPAQAQELASFGKIVKAFIDYVEAGETPLATASELLAELQYANARNDVSYLHNSSKLSGLRKWLPNSPEKIAAYIAIADVLLRLLSRDPGTTIEYNTVINQLNQTIVVTQPATGSSETAPKIGRNDRCPCGSGKKFKHCHGSAK
jgi:hypothetical protein